MWAPAHPPPGLRRPRAGAPSGSLPAADLEGGALAPHRVADNGARQRMRARPHGNVEVSGLSRTDVRRGDGIPIEGKLQRVRKRALVRDAETNSWRARRHGRRHDLEVGQRDIEHLTRRRRAFAGWRDHTVGRRILRHGIRKPLAAGCEKERRDHQQWNPSTARRHGARSASGVGRRPVASHPSIGARSHAVQRHECDPTPAVGVGSDRHARRRHALCRQNAPSLRRVSRSMYTITWRFVPVRSIGPLCPCLDRTLRANARVVTDPLHSGSADAASATVRGWRGACVSLEAGSQPRMGGD